MPSKFTHRFLFYESWLADLNEPSKEFEPQEKWQVVEAIFKAQVLGDVAPLDALPLVIRRALSLPTMTEQLRTIIDKQAGASDRAQQAVLAKKAAAEKRARESAERADREAIARKETEKSEQEARKKAFEQKCIDALGAPLFNAIRADYSGRDVMNAIWSLAVAGHEGCRAFMPNWDSSTTFEIIDITKYQQL